MKINISKIKLSELESFVKSKIFTDFETIPITGLRVASYINNPVALPDDVVLYLGFSDKKLVAFRTFFAGQANTTPELIRFGWCSGNWVHPDYRRKGFSEQLLKEAFTDWKGQLMFTNYAPNSEQLYLKTGRFFVIHQFHGFRGYLFPKPDNLFPEANKNIISRVILSLMNILLSLISKGRAGTYKYRQNHDIRFDLLELPDEICLQLTEQNHSNLFFKRGRTELNWIFQYPWMTNNEDDYEANYPFSSFSKDFRYRTVKIFQKNKFVGFFLFSIKNNHLKTLLFEFSAGLENDIAEFIKNYCIQQKIDMVTIYNFDIANALLKRKFPFLYGRKYGQKIYGSFQVKQNPPLLFQDGDGDVIFT